MPEDNTPTSRAVAGMSRGALLNVVLLVVLAGTSLFACNAQVTRAEYDDLKGMVERANAAATRANTSGAALTKWAYDWTYVKGANGYDPANPHKDNAWAKHVDTKLWPAPTPDHVPPPPPPPKW